MQTIDEALDKLQASKFRSKFKLTDHDKVYVRVKGLDVIRSHAADFVHKRLAPAFIPNDGKQTPMKGHPVFIAQHATGCCCRGCLERIHRIKKGHDLSSAEVDYIVNVVMFWIQKEMMR